MWDAGAQAHLRGEGVGAPSSGPKPRAVPLPGQAGAFCPRGTQVTAGLWAEAAGVSLLPRRWVLPGQALARLEAFPVRVLDLVADRVEPLAEKAGTPVVWGLCLRRPALFQSPACVLLAGFKQGVFHFRRKTSGRPLDWQRPLGEGPG